jgi:hypothetical protein
MLGDNSHSVLSLSVRILSLTYCSLDMWWLGLAVFLVCIVEVRSLSDISPSLVNVFAAAEHRLGGEFWLVQHIFSR